MNRGFLIWATVLVASLIGTGLSIRILAVQSVPLSESLFLRGLSCLLLTIAFAYKKRLSLCPKSLRTQMFRALIAGLALTFFSMSYNWLSASAVSVLSNVDVPLLIVLGPLIGVRASVRTRLLAAISILFLVWYISELEIQTNLVYGLASLLIGTLLLCFGFVFIKKTMTEESEAITILVPSIAIMVYGVIERVAAPATIMVWPPSLAVVWPPSLAVVWPPSLAVVWPPTAAMVWTPSLIIIGLLSGVGMFAAYFATIRLYSLTDLVSAEFPTLISSILIQPIEAIFLGEHLHSTYIVSSIGFVIMIYLILKWQSFENSRSSEIAFAK